jgi:hypothetical protein
MLHKYLSWIFCNIQETQLHQLFCYIAQMTHLNVDNSCYISSLINAKNAVVTLIRIFLCECSLYKILISINMSCYEIQ